VIAIDGPAASGKSTLGFLLAQRLGYLYLDTGSMYRALTLAAIRQGVPLDDANALIALADRVDLDVLPLRGETDGRQYTVLLDGEDVTWALRLPAVDAAVSQVSAVSGVRARLVERQRAFGRRGGVVMVGRDIGTVVMPNAPLKLYIVATAEERARRRLRDRKLMGYDDDDFAATLADVVRRDHIDSTREHSPLHPASDSIIIDTTDRHVEVLLEEVVTLLNQVAA
jgi:cytidylate kinase